MYPFIVSIWNQSKKTNEDYAANEKLLINFNRAALLQKENASRKLFIQRVTLRMIDGSASKIFGTLQTVQKINCK